MSHFIRFFILSLVITLVTPISVHALTTGLVSNRKPDGLVLSTGNLYFTSHDDAGATVWRTGQDSIPGQEGILYWEAGARFGDIVFAKVDGSFFGYFFATTGSGAVVTIKRVPLTGGAATVLATITNVGDVDVANSHRNLITDGENLYWQDVRSVRKMPIRGGPVTVLDTASPNTPTAGLVFQGLVFVNGTISEHGNIIYASVADIRFVPPGGAITTPLVRTITNASSRVTALWAVDNGVYWGEQGGAVRLKVGATTKTLPSTPGLVPTSISTNGRTAGAAQAWAQCGSQSCRLQFAFPSFNSSMAIAADALGVSVTSSGNVFWGDAAGVHRQVF